MSKYKRVIMVKQRISSYIVKADDVDEAIDAADGEDFFKTIYEDDLGDFGVVEVIEVGDEYDGGEYDLTAEYDGDIIFQEWF